MSRLLPGSKGHPLWCERCQGSGSLTPHDWGPDTPCPDCAEKWRVFLKAGQEKLNGNDGGQEISDKLNHPNNRRYLLIRRRLDEMNKGPSATRMETVNISGPAANGSIAST